jgi:acyl-CoA dehydrogenase
VEEKMRAEKLRDPREAHGRGVISDDELAALDKAAEATARVVAVDAFPMTRVSPLAKAKETPARANLSRSRAFG